MTVATPDPTTEQPVPPRPGRIARIREQVGSWQPRRLGLRTREALLAAFAAAGLTVSGRTEVRPHHPKVNDKSDALHAARAGEVTSLWRLKTH